MSDIGLSQLEAHRVGRFIPGILSDLVFYQRAAAAEWQDTWILSTNALIKCCVRASPALAQQEVVVILHLPEAA